MKTRLVLSALTLVVSAACGSPSEPAGVTRVDGLIRGVGIDPAFAGLYVYEAIPDAALLVISDQPGVCEAITDGSISVEMFETYDVRPGTTTLSWTVFGNGAAISAGPVALGIPEFEGSSPLPPPEQGQFGFPSLSITEAACGPDDFFFDPDSVVLEDAGVEALGARLEFTTFPADSGLAEGTLYLRMEDETLQGEFSARICEGSPAEVEFIDCP